jgi:dihydrofolate reductase
MWKNKSMRKIVLWDVMTLDGYFEGVKPWDLGFHNTVWGKELEDFSLEQAKDIGTLLFGRKTYEGMATYWSKEKGATTNPKVHSKPARFKAERSCCLDWVR